MGPQYGMNIIWDTYYIEQNDRNFAGDVFKLIFFN